MGANDFVCLRKLRRRNNRRLRFDDSSFLVRNLLQGITEPFFVIESDRRNHSDIRLNGIGRVESSAQTRFQNDDVDLRFGEMFQRERSRDFEESRMRLPISDELPNVGQARCNFVFGNHLAVDADSFAKSDKVRGDKKTGPIFLGATDRIDHRAD